MTWISHGCTCVPQSPSHLSPHPITLGCPSAPALSALSHASNLDWQSVSHMIIYMFQGYSLRSSHPHLLPHYACVLMFPWIFLSLLLHQIFFFLIGESLLYNVVLVSAIQHESAISVYIVLPFWASFLLPITLLSAITEYQVELPVSYSNFPVAIYFTHDNIFILPMIMYIFQCLSPFVPSSPSPAVFTSTFLHLCLYSFPANKILIPFF